MAKKKSTSTKDCGCNKKVNEALREQHLKLKLGVGLSLTTTEIKETGPFLVVEKLPTAKRNVKTLPLLCVYCPFCGKKKGKTP